MSIEHPDPPPPDNFDEYTRQETFKNSQDASDAQSADSDAIIAARKAAAVQLFKEDIDSNKGDPNLLEPWDN